MNHDAEERPEILTVRLNLQQAEQRLDKALSMARPELSRAAIQRLIKSGLVFCGGSPVTALSKKATWEMDYQLHLPRPQPTDMAAENIPLEILFEDSHLIVINKAAGMVVHPGAGVNSGTLVNALLHHCGDELSGVGGRARPGIVHRLDKDTSGIMVVAKNDAAHQGLARQFEERTASRQYLAITKGVPKKTAGTIDAAIGRHPVHRTKMAVNQKGRRAVTNYRVLAGYPPFALISCRLQTGRTHQIRVHMAHIGVPLLGDPLYGRPLQAPKQWSEPIKNALTAFRRQALHAATLGFQHPASGKEMKYETAPPADFQDILVKIKSISSMNV